MSTLSMGSAASDVIFAELLQALERTEDRLAVLTDFISRHPEREAEMRELAGFNSILDDSRDQVPPPPPPTQLGEFRIGRLIKIGGMGEIYEAYHQRLDRRVALKIVRRGWTTSYARERFAREQHVLAKLHHSNIVPIQTGGEDGPIQYFTMPFIEGSALNHVLEVVANLSSARPAARTPSVTEIVSRFLQPNVAEASAPSNRTGTKLTRGRLPRLHGSVHMGERGERVQLSRSYFLSVARTMIDVADAIEYAHQAGVLHRDLKPANVMIEPNGHCWVIDFGLAAKLCRHVGPANLDLNGERLGDNLTGEWGGGTYNYMAPERWQGKPADARSDIFSLGTILYELLTLRPAYSGPVSTQIKNQILNGSRVPASQCVKHLPTDLAAIADKAMDLIPAQRYQSAAEFAEDIRRWLKFEPIVARPASPWRRTWLWTRRKPALAAATLLAVVASSSTAAAVVDSYVHEAQAAQAESRMATSRLRQSRLLQLLLSDRASGWSDVAWNEIKQLAVEDLSLELKSLAAETRLGIDTTTEKLFEYSSSHLAYNPSGDKLLMIQYDPPPLAGDPISSVERSGQIWNSVTHELKSIPRSSHDSTGPVAYPDNDRPWQLVWNRHDSNAIGVWNLITSASDKRLIMPTSLSEPPLAWSLTADGNLASVIVREDENNRLLVWETSTSRQVMDVKTEASHVELSPDGELVALACPEGVIEIWAIPNGQMQSRFSESHAEAFCFAWTKDRRRNLDGSNSGWLLAAGSMSDLAIWDVSRQSVRSRCVGSSYEIFKLAFSPDGMTLASVGRGNPILWNVETGKMLLRLGFANTLTSVVYTPDGRSLAVGSYPIWGSPGITQVYNLQEMRGQQTMHGLRAPVAQVRISANNRIVAALSDNWQLAVWDVKKHRLLHTYQVPIGIYAQTAGLAIDADERRVAVVTGQKAMVWDIESGEVLKSVDLPPGFLDSIEFSDKQTLISARQESLEPMFPPAGPNPQADKTPRVCRVRNLLSAEPAKPLVTITDFRRSAVSITVTPSGQRVLVEGYDELGAQPDHRKIKLFELPSGRAIWDIQSPFVTPDHRVVTIDPTGRILGLWAADFQSGLQLMELETRAILREVKVGPKGIGPGAVLNVTSRYYLDLPDRSFLTVTQNENDQELLRLAIVQRQSDCTPRISLDKRYVVYGCADGTVIVADLWSLERQLAERGLH